SAKSSLSQKRWGGGAGHRPVTVGRGRTGPSTTTAAPPRSPSPSVAPTGRIGETLDPPPPGEGDHAKHGGGVPAATPDASGPVPAPQSKISSSQLLRFL